MEKVFYSSLKVGDIIKYNKKWQEIYRIDSRLHGKFLYIEFVGKHGNLFEPFKSVQKQV